MKLLNKSNFLDYAKKQYLGLRVVNTDNFSAHLRVFTRMNIMLSTYDESKYRVLMNTLITLYNTFGVVATTRLLFFFTHESNHTILKTFIEVLNISPENIPEVDLYNIEIIDSLYHTLKEM